ncbi:MAG: MATE family efflux transporter [Candidatus Binatia bacterium]|nr:MATE family efflux transporter [Candidatus Binatia bacterium]
MALLPGTTPLAGTSTSETRRVVWNLAWPVILALVSESLVGLVDMFMVARLGASAVAAVGVGGQIMGAVTVTMMAIGTGTVALVARSVGAGTLDEAHETLGQSILAASTLGIVAVIPVLLWAEPFVQAFGVAPEVTAEATVYVRAVMLAIAPSSVLFVIGSALRGAGDTRTPLAIGLVVNSVNVFANWVLIFGHLGFPALGVLGSALATALSFTLGAVLLSILLAGGRLRLHVERRHLVPDFTIIRRIFRIGYPAAIEQFLMQVGFLVYLVFAARYGTDAVAAYFIGVRILALAFLPGFGFAAAASTLVGQHLGAGEPEQAERAGWMSAWMSVCLMSTVGVVVFLLAEPIARLLVDEVGVIAGTASFIYMLGIAQPFMAIDFTLGGALRGAGDTRFPLWTMLVAFYAVRLGLSALAVFVFDLSLPWLWSALIADYVVRAALKTWRFRGAHWRSIEV